LLTRLNYTLYVEDGLKSVLNKAQDKSRKMAHMYTHLILGTHEHCL